MKYEVIIWGEVVRLLYKYKSIKVGRSIISYGGINGDNMRVYLCLNIHFANAWQHQEGVS